MKKYIYTTLVSAGIWTFAFFFSFLFFTQEGELAINFFLFKFIMATVLFAIAFWALKWLYKKLDVKERKDILEIIIIALIVNILIDLIVLVPFFEYSLLDYLIQIASVYVVMIPLSGFVAFKYLSK